MEFIVRAILLSVYGYYGNPGGKLASRLSSRIGVSFRVDPLENGCCR